MQTVQQLISGYLDGELTTEEAEQLAAALQDDPQALDLLAMGSFINSQLLDWMSQSHIADRAALVSTRAADDSRRTMKWPASTSDQTRNNSLPASEAIVTEPRSRSRWWSLGALAAALLIVASVSILTYVLTSRPTVVAQLTSANGCEWGKSQAPISVGSLLVDHQELVLNKGSALVTFVSGTQLLVEAPTSVRLLGPNRIHLDDGRIAAKVPTQARGFAVTSSLAEFVDLGTAFTLTLKANNSFQLHVFEGLVELQLDKRFGEAQHQPLRVAEVRTVSFDVQSGEITAPQFEAGKQMPF